MGIIDRFFSKKINSITEKKALDIRAELYNALFANLSKGTTLFKDASLKKIIEVGYENNPDVFGIINTLASKGASIKMIPYIGEKESDFDPLKDLFKKTFHDYNDVELNMEWLTMIYCSGEAMLNFEAFKSGNDQGNLSFIGIMPSQNTEIYSNGWKQPIGYYEMDLSGEPIQIQPENVQHTRVFRNVRYENGRNFRGLSPLRVAYQLISGQNNSYELIQKMFENPLPPSIIFEKNNQGLDLEKGTDNTLAQTATEKRWMQKAGKKRGIPYFTNKEVGKIDLSYTNLRDLELIDIQNNVKRALCVALGVPSQAFNDPTSSTYNNMKEAEKALYINRVIPDKLMYVDAINKIIEPSGIQYKIDLSDIQVLHEEKSTIVKNLLEGVRMKVVHPNEFREELGLDELTDDQLEELQLLGVTFPEMDIENMITDNE